MKQFSLFILCMLVLHTAVWAATTGKVMGVITEAGSKNPIAEVEVALKGTELNAITDANGRFVFLAVPPGRYILQAASASHTSYEQPVQVTPDFVVTANFEMQKDQSKIPGSPIWFVVIGAILVIILISIFRMRKQA